MRAPLPIDERLDELRQALRAGHALLVAPTGSGKSTAVPLALRDEPWLAGQRILLLEPRRPAARLTAARMAALCGEALGETVGYQVRFERCVGPQTRIEVLTEGILTRRLQSDPALSGVGLLIFDEFHERSLEAELALALALDVTASLRPDLRLLLMSATLDEPALAALLGAAPIVRGTGRLHPVTIRYAEQPPKDPVAAVLPAVYKLLAEQSGDVLAFLPGTRAIAECQSAWRAPAEPNAAPSMSGRPTSSATMRSYGHPSPGSSSSRPIFRMPSQSACGCASRGMSTPPRRTSIWVKPEQSKPKLVVPPQV